jgi:protein-disulfide isomerase
VSTRARVAIVAGLALVVVVAGVLISQGGDDPAGSSEESSPVLGTLDQVEQRGFSVGDRQAPVAMVEYGDLQCPFCADAANESIPGLVEDYVVPGDLRITFQPVAFIGEHSVEAAEMAAAAALQDRGFAFTEQFYARQGAENSGYVTEDFLRSVAEQVPGLDVERALADRTSAEVERILAEASANANRDGVQSTPTFLIGRGEGALERLELAPDDLDGFRAEIEQRLGG